MGFSPCTFVDFRIESKHGIKDIEHQQTTALITALAEEGVQTVVIGDRKAIRQRIDYGPSANQRLHQWSADHARHLLTYKAERGGMAVIALEEKSGTPVAPVQPVGIARQAAPRAETLSARSAAIAVTEMGLEL